jgi:hypothetical protein
MIYTSFLRFTLYDATLNGTISTLLDQLNPTDHVHFKT